MSRTDEQIAADAWRSVRLAGAPLVRPDTTSPCAVIREAHVRLRDMRQARQSRRAGNDNGDDRHD
jgi:hypothetical protein